MIKTFLFDMGNVLVRFSHERMCSQIGGLCGRTAAEIKTLLIESGLQWDFERGFLSEAEFHRKIESLVSREIVFPHLVLAASDIFELNADIVPVLDVLRARGHRLVLLSNTSISHFQYIQRTYTVLDRFDDFVLSYEVGALKPEAAIYEAALRSIQCAPHECFYTDDISEYVVAARTHGLQAGVFTDVSSLLSQLAQCGVELTETELASQATEKLPTVPVRSLSKST